MRYCVSRLWKIAKNRIINDRGLTYRVRLKRLGLTTLETRKLRGDMIEVFKILKGFGDVKVTDFSLCQVLDLEPDQYWTMNLNCVSLRRLI